MALQIPNREQHLVVVDIETTGVNPFIHDAVSIAFVPLVRELPSLELFIAHEQVNWSPFAYENFQRFRNKWSRLAIAPSAACDQIESYFNGLFGGIRATLIGHNIGFDVAFLRKISYQGDREELPGVSHRMVDTHTLLYVLAMNDYIPFEATTSDGAFRHFGIHVEKSRRHEALADAEATRELFLRVMSEFGERLHPLLRELP